MFSKGIGTGRSLSAPSFGQLVDIQCLHEGSFLEKEDRHLAHARLLSFSYKICDDVDNNELSSGTGSLLDFFGLLRLGRYVKMVANLSWILRVRCT